jgi:hypothetical protein
VTERSEATGWPVTERSEATGWPGNVDPLADRRLRRPPAQRDAGADASRLRRLAGLAGLVVAVLAAGWLLTQPAPDPAPAPAGAADAGVRDVWPAATVVRTPGRLSDGRAYTPRYHKDVNTSVGMALTNDGAFVRLLVRTPTAERELLRLPAGENPQFNGFASEDDDLVFMTSAGSMSASALYRATWSDGVARLLTEDTGTVVFFNSQYDVVIADGAAHWAAAGANVTEIRSVPLAGGAVAVRRVDGSYALSAWPWLTSVETGAVRLHNPQTGATQSVPAAPDEMVTCGPVWCRVLVIGPGGQPARTDVMRPTGADRRRLAAGNTTSAVLDVALLDRFEVLTQSVDGDGPGPVSLTLILFDLSNNRAVPLARGVATVHARGPVVWWSTGSEEAVEWFALDLRTLN